MRATSCFNICFGLNTEFFAVMRNSNHLNSGCFHVCGFQGAAVLRMLSEFLTEPVFARGLSVSINPVIGPRNLITTATVSTDMTNQSKCFYNYDTMTMTLRVWVTHKIAQDDSFKIKLLPFLCERLTGCASLLCLPSLTSIHLPSVTQCIQTCGTICNRSVLLKTFPFPDVASVGVSAKFLLPSICFQAVDNTPGIHIPHTVHDIMNRWTLQMGFPVVTINTRTGSITQKHFLLDPDSVVERPSQFK